MFCYMSIELNHFINRIDSLPYLYVELDYVSSPLPFEARKTEIMQQTSLLLFDYITKHLCHNWPVVILLNYIFNRK